MSEYGQSGSDLKVLCFPRATGQGDVVGGGGGEELVETLHLLRRPGKLNFGEMWKKFLVPLLTTSQGILELVCNPSVGPRLHFGWETPT